LKPSKPALPTQRGNTYCSNHFSTSILLTATNTLLMRIEYIADENLLLESHVRKRGGKEISADDQTVKTINTAANTSSETPDMSKIGRVGPPTFDLCPDSVQDKQHMHVPSGKQAELMNWHYLLGHLSFPKLKALARIGKIPKHLANVLPPVCASCAFGAMTKVPWKSM
jgi:hypothetical protein